MDPPVKTLNLFFIDWTRMCSARGGFDTCDIISKPIAILTYAVVELSPFLRIMSEAASIILQYIEYYDNIKYIATIYVIVLFKRSRPVVHNGNTYSTIPVLIKSTL